MPTYAELATEACWRTQFVPPALQSLAVNLRVRYGQDGNTIASPGDNRHLNGGHRSRRWIRDSQWCTNRTYTVSYADDQAGDENWYAAIDIGLATQAELLAMCKRLDAAVRAGLLEEISEWYGNLDGDGRVDGWNNILDRLASSDTSHLTHLHITFKRRYANDAALMARVYAVLTGTGTAREIIDMGMQVLAKDLATGKIWLCDGMTRRIVASSDTDRAVGDLRYLAKVGAISLFTGESGGGETKGGIWQGVSDLLGVPLAAAPTVDIEALAVAIVAKLPATTLTRDDVRGALADVLDGAQISAAVQA